MNNMEEFAQQIICQWCKREIWIPGPLSQNPKRKKFYCSYCGQYTKITQNKGGNHERDKV